MKTWILLLRGINVGGRHRLPMKELRQCLSSFEIEGVQTYIQSGNVVFQASEEAASRVTERLAAAIETHHGFSPPVLVLSQGAWQDAMSANPFPEAISEPKSLHLFFLATPPDDPDLDRLREVQLPSERFQLTERVFYLHTPEGLARSKLASRIDRTLGVEMTARNWRTVQKLADLANVG